MTDDDEPSATDCHDAAIGILQGLHMLAEEADHLRLSRTYVALCKAIRACQAEHARMMPGARPRPRRYATLH
ncbi:MAG TPA: hypothetical protein VFN42_01945 [Acetobacteraceae bacterium]|nr:hypothetical protein [Acetobacteraceae bacterium]